MKMMRIPVLYIGGWGRSGSTLLGNILGSIKGNCHIGEVTYIWEHGWKYNHLCGCGKAFQECDFWKQVIDKAFPTGVDIDRMIWIRDKYLSNKKVFLSFLLNNELDHILISEYIENIKKLYCAIYSTGDYKIIIDSSKTPLQLYILSTIPEIELYILHLIRDARGCAYSWNKLVYREDAGKDKDVTIERFKHTESTLKWIFWNIIFELVKYKKYETIKYLRIRYEDFIRETINVLYDIGSFGNFVIPWSRVDDIIIHENHTVWGNPSRLKRGKIKIRLDDAWRREMPWKDQLVVTALAWPWLLKYGYL